MLQLSCFFDCEIKRQHSNEIVGILQESKVNITTQHIRSCKRLAAFSSHSHLYHFNFQSEHQSSHNSSQWVTALWQCNPDQKLHKPFLSVSISVVKCKLFVKRNWNMKISANLFFSNVLQYNYPAQKINCKRQAAHYTHHSERRKLYLM